MLAKAGLSGVGTSPSLYALSVLANEIGVLSISLRYAQRSERKALIWSREEEKKVEMYYEIYKSTSFKSLRVLQVSSVISQTARTYFLVTEKSWVIE